MALVPGITVRQELRDGILVRIPAHCDDRTSGAAQPHPPQRPAYQRPRGQKILSVCARGPRDSRPDGPRSDKIRASRLCYERPAEEDP
jgi:hypothetical protein